MDIRSTSVAYQVFFFMPLTRNYMYFMTALSLEMSDEPNFVYNKQGGVNGITFTYNGISFGGSNIDKALNFTNLKSQLYDIDRFISGQLEEFKDNQFWQRISSAMGEQTTDSQRPTPASLVDAGLSLLPPTSSSDLGGGGVHGQLSKWNGKKVDDEDEEENHNTNYKRKRK